MNLFGPTMSLQPLSLPQINGNHIIASDYYNFKHLNSKRSKQSNNSERDPNQQTISSTQFQKDIDLEQRKAEKSKQFYDYLKNEMEKEYGIDLNTGAIIRKIAKEEEQPKLIKKKRKNIIFQYEPNIITKSRSKDLLQQAIQRKQNALHRKISMQQLDLINQNDLQRKGRRMPAQLKINKSEAILRSLDFHEPMQMTSLLSKEVIKSKKKQKDNSKLSIQMSNFQQRSSSQASIKPPEIEVLPNLTNVICSKKVPIQEFTPRKQPNNPQVKESIHLLQNDNGVTPTKDVEMNDEFGQNQDTYEETQPNANGFFHDTKNAAACSVRVALRVRPLIGRELYESPNICVSCYPESNQIMIGKDRAFTFDKVFDIGTNQEFVFEACVKNLVLGCFQGYNATVLAYGQTGSGKTHTMGSGYTIGLKEEDLGIIPRVIRLIFNEVEKRKHKAEFIIKCTFLEIYNEDLNDLLDHGNIGSGGAAVIDRFMQKKDITIREEKNGNISVYGLKEEKVSCYEELAACLDKGSNFRSTASTLMNNSSSRSHAIFTITIEQHIIEDLYKADGQPAPQGDNNNSNEEFMVAKFHFVDLAGSERAKRTGATGSTLKEGISINKGLLALGNVISALTEEGKKGHVPYRDSKLTRILQDSLGGNSRTSMIACCSPAEVNFEETLNTLKYASRARNIKNKPIVNRDPNSQQIAQLRQQVYELSRELASYRKLLISNNIEFESVNQLGDISMMGPGEGGQGGGGHKEFAFSGKEIQRYEEEIRELKIERSNKEKKIQQIQVQLDIANEQKNQKEVECFSLQKERDIARFQLEQLTAVLKKRNILGELMNEINGFDPNRPLSQEENLDIFFGNSGPCILEEYQVMVEEQKKDIQVKDQQLKTLQSEFEMIVTQSKQDNKMLEEKGKEIERMKRTISKLQKENIQIKNDQRKIGRGQTMTIGQQVNQQQKKAQSQAIERKFQPVLKKKEQEKQWLPEELDYNIKHFNELFIENLSQSLSTVLIKRSNTQEFKDGESKKLDQPEQVISEEEDNFSEDDIEENEVQDSQQIIDEHEEAKKIDNEMQTQIMSQEHQIKSLEGNLKDKESLLDAIKESHKLLQNNLLQAMKNEYHKKIQALDTEIKSLEKERGESLKKAENAQQKNKVEDMYKKKLKDLEDKLKDLRSKDKEQNSMVKEAERQKNRMKNLEDEIGQIKSQKVSLQKQLNDQNKKHRQWREDTAREIMHMKQANRKKDKEIDKLRRENKRKEALAKRKQEELSALQKKNKLDKQKQINAEKDRMKKKNIDIGKIQNWIISNTQKMLQYKEYKQQMSQELQQQQEIEEQIAEEQSSLAQLQVRKEKLEYKKRNTPQNDDEAIYQMNEDIQEIDLEIKQIYDNIESLEEKIDFINLKVTNLNSDLVNLSPDDIETLNFKEVQSIEGARACLGAFFNILLDVNVHKKELENYVTQLEGRLQEIQQQVEESAQQIMASERTFIQDLETARIEHQEREKLLFKIILEYGGPDVMALMTNEEGFIHQNSNDLIQEYLKSKQNEEKTQQSQIQQLQQITSLNKKGQMAKQVIKQGKEQQYNQSKMALSKRVAELERQKREDDKKLESLKLRYDQVNQEKEHFKRQLDQFKNKMKNLEIQDIKNQKQQFLEDVKQSSPKLINQPSLQQQTSQKFQTLSEMRKERKIKKLGSKEPSQPQLNRNTQEPRVIVDEPMEEEGELPPPQEVIKKQESSSVGKLPVAEKDIKSQGETLEVNNVFNRLHSQNKTRVSVLANANQNVTLQNQANQQNTNTGSFVNTQQEPKQTLGFDDDQKWKCIISKDQAHSNQVCALTSVGNQLYSTSNKSLKIWDLDTMTCISDIQAHNSFIRSMTIWEDKKLLLTASDKVIMLWDLISLTNVGTLKGHKDDIKTMCVSSDGNQLFSAGRGTSNSGALLVWDLRKGASAIEEREKSQDIFSLATVNDLLFFGCRNHYVYPMNIKTFETGQPFEPPHFDAVTSLAIIEQSLISGSRDKNLRCWNYESQVSHVQDVMGAHQDWINTLETDSLQKEVYSGSKDGVVKVWKIKHKKLKCMAQLNSSASSINSICRIDKQFGKMFAIGSSDKSIRMWKYKDVAPSESENYESEGSDDEHIRAEYLNEEELDRETQIFQSSQNKEESKQDQMPHKYAPVRQGSASQTSQMNPNKYQQMRQQKRMQEKLKRNQKENEAFIKTQNN